MAQAAVNASVQPRRFAGSTGVRGPAADARDELGGCTPLTFSRMARKRWLGGDRRFTKVVTNFTVCRPLISLRFSRMTYLWLLWPLLLRT